MTRRFQPTRESFIHKGAIKIADKQSDAVAYLYTAAGVVYAQMFYGKQARPTWHYRFKDEARRIAAVTKGFEARRQTFAILAARKAERKAWVNPYKVGDLFRRSWGYDQTNIDWYEVTEVSGKMLTVREIAQEIVHTGDMTGTCTPQPGKYTNEPPKRCLAQESGIKINHYAHAYYVKPQMVAGVPVYGTDRFSTYA